MNCELAEWLTLNEFCSILDGVAADGDPVVNSPHHQQWRDGWIGSKVAKHHQASHVRLVKEERPDFAIRVGGVEYLYEATEVLKPGRKRHDEYRAQTAAGRTTMTDPVEGWITPDQAIDQIHARAVAKAAKQYPAGCRLVLYVNVGFINGTKSIGLPFIDQLGADRVKQSVDPARATFERIELLTCDNLVSV